MLCDELKITYVKDVRLVDLRDIIEGCEEFKKNPDYVADILETIVDDRLAEIERDKIDKENVLQIEKIKLDRANAELEILRIKGTEKESSENNRVRSPEADIEGLIKSIKTLTINLPSKVEAWSLYFNSLEKAFLTKNVPIT